MNKFKFYFIVLIATVVLFSCQKDDPVTIAPTRDYQEQYDKDIDQITEYLNTHYIETYINNPGERDDQDVKISPITDRATQLSLKSYEDNTGTTFPQLTSRTVNLHGFDYKVVAVDDARPGDGHILDILADDETSMPLTPLGLRHESRWRGLRVEREIRGADEPCARFEMQRHLATQMNRAGEITPGRKQHLPAARVATSVDGGLNHHRVERCTIAFRAMRANVECVAGLGSRHRRQREQQSGPEVSQVHLMS